MITALKVLLGIVAVGLIVSIIMQSGRAAGLGAIAGGAETIFGRKKNMDSFFSRLTIGLGLGFMVLSLLLAVLN